MPSLKEIRNRIATVNSTQQITKAMKLVAASKLRKAQEAITQMRPYAAALNKILDNLSTTYKGEIQSPYLQERPVEKVLAILMTSDRGLCGSFNNNIQKYAYNFLQNEYPTLLSQNKVHFLCLGKKGRDFIYKKGLPVIGQEYTEIFNKLNFENVKKIGEYVLQLYADAQYDKVILFYNEFKNVLVQILRSETFLPLQKNTSIIQAQHTDYILEPSAEEIIQDLIPYSLKIKLYRAVLESNASEQGARMTAMDKATENASELLRQLRLEYNRTRQAAITKEILEIVGGAEALKEG